LAGFKFVVGPAIHHRNGDECDIVAVAIFIARHDAMATSASLSDRVFSIANKGDSESSALARRVLADPMNRTLSVSGEDAGSTSRSALDFFSAVLSCCPKL